MRVQIKFDSATTEQVRQMCVALHRVGLTAELSVGVNGPSHWAGCTPHLSESQFASVTGHLVTFNGQTVADALGVS